MKTIRVHQFGGPEVLQLEDLDTPAVGPNQVLIRIRAVGVNPVDTYLRSGTNPAITLPYTPGLDAAGLVEEAGTAVAGFEQGQRVYVAGSVSGTYAELVLCESTQVHPLPSRITFAQGAAIGVPYATAYRSLFHRAQAAPGEVVMVHGASGGVGLAAVQMARAAGLTVIGTAGSEKGRRLVAEQGAHHVVDHTVPGYLDHVKERTAARGVDLILEMLANVNLGQDLAALAPGGRVIVIGSRGKIEITPRDLMSRDADIRGMLLFNVPTRELAGIHAAIGAGLENGTLRPIVGRELPLAEAAAAHVAVLEPGSYGKIVLVP